MFAPFKALLEKILVISATERLTIDEIQEELFNVRDSLAAS